MNDRAYPKTASHVPKTTPVFGRSVSSSSPAWAVSRHRVHAKSRRCMCDATRFLVPRDDPGAVAALGCALFQIPSRQLADRLSSFDQAQLHPGAAPNLPLAPRLLFPPCQQPKVVRRPVPINAVAAPCPSTLDALHGDPRLQRRQLLRGQLSERPAKPRQREGDYRIQPLRGISCRHGSSHLVFHLLSMALARAHAGPDTHSRRHYHTAHDGIDIQFRMRRKTVARSSCTVFNYSIYCLATPRISASLR
jgi:hypothetical protein